MSKQTDMGNEVSTSAHKVKQALTDGTETLTSQWKAIEVGQKKLKQQR